MEMSMSSSQFALLVHNHTKLDIYINGIHRHLNNVKIENQDREYPQIQSYIDRAALIITQLTAVRPKRDENFIESARKLYEQKIKIQNLYDQCRILTLEKANGSILEIKFSSQLRVYGFVNENNENNE